MAKNSFIFNFKELLRNPPKAFIVFLLLLLITEVGGAQFFSTHTLNSTDSKMRQKIIAAGNMEMVADILIFGDSSAGNAINANVLESQTRLKSFNLALFGDVTLAGNYLMLKEYLANKNPPKYIIMMNVYDVWERGPHGGDTVRVFARNYPQIVFEVDWIKVFPRDIKDKLRMIRNLILSILPSEGYKYDVRKLIKNAPGFFSNYLTQSEEIRKKLYKHKGSSLHDSAGKEVVLADARSHEAYIKNNEFTVSNWNRYFLKKILDEARQNNIKVFICYPPLYEDLYKEVADSEHILAYKLFMEEMVDSSNNISFLNDNFYLTDANELGTVDHLSPSRAIIFTNLISKKILKHSKK